MEIKIIENFTMSFKDLGYGDIFNFTGEKQKDIFMKVIISTDNGNVEEAVCLNESSYSTCGRVYKVTPDTQVDKLALIEAIKVRRSS